MFSAKHKSAYCDTNSKISYSNSNIKKHIINILEIYYRLTDSPFRIIFCYNDIPTIELKFNTIVH